MQLEDYFEFLSPDDIRIKGTRAGIETVLYDYIYQSQTAEEIAERYDVLTLEHVYATILYYLHNRDSVSAYIAAWLQHGEQARAAQARDPSFRSLEERIREARARGQQQAPAGTAPG